VGKAPSATNDHRIEHVSPQSLRPYPGNARKHNRRQKRALEASIRRFGFMQAVLVSKDNEIIAGHGRVEAAKSLGLTEIPIIRIEHLSETDRRAYVIADNKIAEMARWDKEILAIELQNLIEVGFDPEIVGFDAPEIDLLFEGLSEARCDSAAEDISPRPTYDGPSVTRPGDIWLLGPKSQPRHRLICEDARESRTFLSLLGPERAALLLTDPPYNVRIGGVSGKGRIQHREFAMASGEMTGHQFTQFLQQFMKASLQALTTGALAYVFMDWRHIFELLSAAQQLKLNLINLCVWNKSNGGMGSLYRSKHELVFIFGRGKQSHCNNVELGKHGRNRTNVWDYHGESAFHSGRESELEMHPTVKPVSMLADAIRDVTKAGDIVLDPFCGSGSTIIAAEKTSRLARAIEIDGHYCDVAVRRWEKWTGKSAYLQETGESFEAVAERRQETVALPRRRRNPRGLKEALR
jgi:DNA modification methylase